MSPATPGNIELDAAAKYLIIAKMSQAWCYTQTLTQARLQFSQADTLIKLILPACKISLSPSSSSLWYEVCGRHAIFLCSAQYPWSASQTESIFTGVKGGRTHSHPLCPQPERETGGVKDRGSERDRGIETEGVRRTEREIERENKKCDDVVSIHTYSHHSHIGRGTQKCHGERYCSTKQLSRVPKAMAVRLEGYPNCSDG
jgi:hypothetical protein